MKYKRKYENHWNKEKIEKVLEERLQELKSNGIKSKSRIKLLKAKISKLNKALKGKINIGGQILPNKNKSTKSKNTTTTKSSNTTTTKSSNTTTNTPGTTKSKNNTTTTPGTTKSKNTSTNVTNPLTTTNPTTSTNTTKDTNSSSNSSGISSKKKRIKKICYRCRKRGHLLQDCRENDNESICFKCGSTNHTLKNCKLTNQEEVPFANCFVCGERGHLSSKCSKNPNGIFPKGSGCYFCGSVMHKKINCPNYIKNT